ncbi:MAG: mechanosensitive ion channel protein MscS [Syntrophobacterales bacterium CG_4_8_14_3_um_filter_49_14]|nr:MAG: mechanosensitive ion channel protein MscS [Syntrophobacterales bacterium CG23_combo_of_CG06-09_8_20_14_all_48_27]PJC72684.1 MAG: mechanosensitive ion channel protein MscS [Syntrophobacterales bacterium CG_4_8_14_3_um_filter_49_14]
MPFLKMTYYGNTLNAWLWAVIVAIVIFATLKVLQKVIIKHLAPFAEKTETFFDNLAIDLLKSTKFFFFLFLSLYAGSLTLSLPERASSLLRNATLIAFFLQAAIWGNHCLSFFLNRYKSQKLALEQDAASVATITAFGFIGRLFLWTIVLLLILDNLGVDITSLIAGLGIGGIALALAAQNILGDLFASLSIMLDKPFVIGDFIIVDEYMGSIEQIGLKTTHLRSLSGEQLIISNADLLKSRIRNYKRMYERRVVFSLGVIYQTPYDKLKTIPAMVREIIEAQEQTRFDRAHFKEFGNSSLNFEIVYWVKNPDYNVYMDLHQAINMEIFRRFEEEGIVFAYPTQTLYLNREESTE